MSRALRLDLSRQIGAVAPHSYYQAVPAWAPDTFRLHEGSMLSGALAWAVSAGAGTARSRDKEPVFHGSDPLHWVDYSRVADSSAGTFRYVLVEARWSAGSRAVMRGTSFSP